MSCEHHKIRRQTRALDASTTQAARGGLIKTDHHTTDVAAGTCVFLLHHCGLGELTHLPPCQVPQCAQRARHEVPEWMVADFLLGLSCQFCRQRRCSPHLLRPSVRLLLVPCLSPRVSSPSSSCSIFHEQEYHWRCELDNGAGVPCVCESRRREKRPNRRDGFRSFQQSRGIPPSAKTCTGVTGSSVLTDHKTLRQDD